MLTALKPLVLFPRVGPMELLLILALALVVFGPGKLPQLGQAIGKAARGFKEALSGKDAGGTGGDKPA